MPPLPDLITGLTWYAAAAFAFGFIVSWVVCANPYADRSGLVPYEQREQRQRLFGLVKRGYRAYDSGTGWYDRIAWFLGLFKTNAGVAALVAATGAAGTYGAIELKRHVIEPLRIETAAVPPVALPEVRQMRNSTVFAIEGKDNAGREASFDVVVLNKSFLWVRGSAEDLEKDGTPIPRDQVAASVLDDEVRNALRDAKEVITVGTASQEGVAAEEVARAERRAKQAASLVATAVGAEVPIYTLNLGQYSDTCANCETGATSWQRPFIVIAVTKSQPDTNIGEALSDALTGKEKLPSPSSYSAFALTRFR